MTSRRLFAFLLVGIAVVILSARWGYYFSSPTHEEGDTALNALQITNAKHLGELHGNYSRFRFHHPGPAFFYVYAAAERLLVDLLPLGLTPFNAHAIAGLLLQAGCFALALTIAAQWCRTRLFVPVLLLGAAVHFSLAGQAFWSIWPPHVLLMPFLAFWISCLSLACGKVEHLVWAVLTGSLLVHGHVAQPLFVGTLFPAAYLLTWYRHGKPWRRQPRVHLAATLVLLVFLLPLGLDLAQGADSNFSEILRHLRDNSERLKKPLKSLLYLLSFFGYVHNQEEFLRELSVQSLRFFRLSAPAFGVWAALLALTAWFWPKLAEKRSAAAVFWNTGAWFWLGTLGLGLFWGIAQTGLMHEFNSYFFYSVTYLAFWPLADRIASLGQKFPRQSGLIATLLLIAAALVTAAGLGRGAFQPGEAGLFREDAVQQALSADTRRSQPKLLAFGPEDWAEAAAVALALTRSGIPYYVDQPWEFMHGKRAVPVEILTSDDPPVSVWRILSTSRESPPRPLGNDRYLELDAAPFVAEGGEIDFATEGNYLRYQVTGFSNLHGSWAWMSQDNALLQFSVEPVERDVMLVFEIVPWRPLGGIFSAPLEIYFNGTLLLADPLQKPGRLTVRVPHRIWRSHPVATLRWHLPGARDPRDNGVPSDWSGGTVAVRRLRSSLAP